MTTQAHGLCPVLSGIHREIRHCRRFLKQTGVVVSQSGGFEVPQGWLSGHSALGPASQDKVVNQDRLILWKPRKHPASGLDWAIAMADGVTSSWHSEFAAGLACWSALKALAESDNARCGHIALTTAVESINTAGAAYRRCGSGWCPDGEYAATWKHRLDCGAFLQTTLTLVWCASGRCQLMRIGDGGATVHRTGESRVLLAVDPVCHRVHALGPDSSGVKPDGELDLTLPAGAVLTVYTDGLAGSLESNPDALFQWMNRKVAGEATGKRARSIVRQLEQEHHALLDDNLTLAMVAVER